MTKVSFYESTIKLHLGQAEQVFVFTQTERFDRMNEYQHSPALLSQLVALRERIEAEASHLRVTGLYEFPKPFLRVKDTEHGIVVGFSSEEEYVSYCQIVSRKGGRRHA